MIKLPEKIKTEKSAIKQSILMWHWLWKNPDKEKSEYPGYGIRELWLADCACCEYYCNTLRLNILYKCRNGTINCPLASKELCAFCYDNSAYEKWEDGKNKKTNAHKIYIALVDYWKQKGWKDKAVNEVIYD